MDCTNENLKWKTVPHLLGQRDRQNSTSSAARQLKWSEHEGGQHRDHRSTCSE